MDDSRLRLYLQYGFGLLILLVYFVLALVIALGSVNKDTSYGLDIVLAALGPLGGIFAQWAFSGNNRSDKSDKG